MRSAGMCLVFLALIGLARAEDPPFSGPQAGEKLPPFKVRGVFASSSSTT
jgi:hypothetical protein